jgi:HK97 family phage major capsid protein
LVSVPADTTVGTNRSIETDLEVVPQPDLSSNQEVPDEAESTNLENLNNSTKSKENTMEHQDIIKAERSRVAEITDLATKFNLTSESADFIKEGKSVEEFKDYVLTKQSDTRKVNQAPSIITSTRSNEYSIGKAFLAAQSGDWSQAGLEREMNQDFARAAGKAFTGNNFFVDPNMTVRASAVGTSNGGAELVGSTYMGDRLIDQLYAKTISNQVGVEKMLGLVGNAVIPMVTSGTTAGWGNETSTTSESSLGTDSKTLTPKQLTVVSKFSRQLLIQGIPQIDQLVRSDILKQIALAVDTALIKGTGLSNQPTGILATSGIGAVSLGTNGDDPTYAKVNA